MIGNEADHAVDPVDLVLDEAVVVHAAVPQVVGDPELARVVQLLAQPSLLRAGHVRLRRVGDAEPRHEVRLPQLGTVRLVFRQGEAVRAQDEADLVDVGQVGIAGEAEVVGVARVGRSGVSRQRLTFDVDGQCDRVRKHWAGR